MKAVHQIGHKKQVARKYSTKGVPRDNLLMPGVSEKQGVHVLPQRSVFDLLEMLSVAVLIGVVHKLHHVNTIGHVPHENILQRP